MNQSLSRDPGSSPWPGTSGMILLPSVVVLLAGCSTAFYKGRADKDVYAVIEKVEKDIFGQSKLVSVDTPYSARPVREITPQEIIADRNAEGRLRLSIEEMLDLAVNTSRAYQSERENLYLTALSLTGVRHDFRPGLTGISRATGTRQSDSEELGSVTSTLALGQALKSGASLGISIANDLLKFYTGDARRSAISTINVNLLQPLLRGAGRKIAAEQLTQASRDVAYGVREFSHFQNTFAAGLVVDYFRLLQQKESIFNEYSNYQALVRSTAYLRAREDRERPLDVSQAEQAELAAKNRYINSIVSFRNNLDRFKIDLGLPQSTDLRLVSGELVSLVDKGLVSLRLDGAQAFRLALAHRLPLLNEIDRFEDQQRKVRVAANRLKADLNIFANASATSDQPTNYEDFDFDEVRADFGVQLNLPLDRLRERNDYRATLIAFEAQLRSLSRTTDDLKLAIDQGLRELEQFRQSYEIQKNSVLLAQRRVTGARLNLEAGTAIFRDLEEAQDALIDAQNAVTAALVDYLEARLNLLVDLGIFNLEEKQFWLKEKASKVDLNHPSPNNTGDGADAISLEEQTVVTPQELFPDDE
ncbi:MAG: TolC family protein [Verrucomicrobiota bacterium]